MTQRLLDLLKVRPGESRMVALLSGLMIAAAAGMGMGGSGIDALFFARAGVEYLPTMYMALGVVTLVTMLAISTLLGRVEQRALYVTLPLVLALALAAERAVLLFDFAWFYPVMWLAKGVMAAFQGLSMWGLASAICDTRQAKRLFPLFSSGAILGSALGSSLTPLVVSVLHSENLILVWAGSLGVSFALGRALLSVAPRSAQRASSRGQPSLVAEMRQGSEFVRKSRLLTLIAVAAFFFSVAWFSLEFPFNSAATAAYPDVDALAGFLGMFMGIITAVALAISLFAANRLFARFGIMPMLLTFPMIYLVGFAVLPFVSPFPLIAAFRFAQIGWASGVAGTAWQAMFNVIPAQRRDQARAFIDGVPGQMGVLAAGVLLNIAQRVLRPEQIYWIGLGATIPILIVLWRAIGAYRAALVDALKAGQPQVFYDVDEPFGGFATDAAAARALIEGAVSPDPALRRVSIELLGSVSTPLVEETLLGALRDSDAQTRVAALNAWSKRGAASAAASIARCLHDVDPDVRAAAVRVLRKVAGIRDEARLSIRGLLSDPDPSVKAQAALALAPDLPEARGALRQMASDADPETRAHALAALGEWSAPEALVPIKNALNDPDASVRHVAASALAAFDDPRALDALSVSLADENRSVREAAARSLAMFGDASLKHVLAALADPQREAGALAALERLPIEQAGDKLRAYARERAKDAMHYYRLWAVVASQGGGDRLGLLADSLIHRARRHASHALKAIGMTQDRDSMALAIENLRSPNPEQRSNALETLEALAGSVEIVRPLLQVFDPIAPGPTDPTDALLQAMQERDSWLRACGALAASESGQWEIKAALEVLAASDSDALAREAAELSLNRAAGARAETLSTMEKILFLRRVALFADIEPAELRGIAQIASQEQFEHGAILGKQDEQGDDAYVITFGEVRIVSAKQGRKVEVARCRVGEIIGEMSIITSEPRMASLIADGEVRALSISREDFTTLLRERPQISLAVIRVLCARLKAVAATSQ